MRRHFRLAWPAVALFTVLATGIALAGGGGGGARGGAALQPSKGASQKVSLDVKNAPLYDALTLLFAGTDQSLMLDPDIVQLPQTLTVTLKDVTLEHAVRAICKLHGLEYETDKEGLWVIMRRSDLVKVGGTTLPLIGATVGVKGGGGPRSGTHLFRFEDHPRPTIYYGGEAPAGFQERTQMTRLGLSDLVDLQVENAPLSDVAAGLGVKRDGKWEVEILVHEPVPKDIKVTAKVYRMRRDDLLLMLAEQANLDLSIDSPAPGERSADRPHTRVYFIPKPDLRVFGPGVGLEAAKAWMEAKRARTSAAEALRAWEKRTGESTRSLGFRLCPKCDDQAMMLHWKFCPHCSTKLPSEEEQPEKNE